MSDLINKSLSKIMAVIMVVLFIVGVREAILTDETVAIAFGGIMEVLPFAKIIADVVCEILKYPNTIPIAGASSVLSEFIKLSVMSCIRPLVVGILTTIFLRLPDGTWYEKEKYMESFQYKIKALIISVVSAPLLAVFASMFTAYLYNMLMANLGTVISGIVGIVSVLALSSLSIIPLLATGTALGVAILWRLVITLLAEVAVTFGTNAFCICIYVAFLSGIQSQITTSIVALVIWLIIMDFLVECLKRTVVSKPNR